MTTRVRRRFRGLSQKAEKIRMALAAKGELVPMHLQEIQELFPPSKKRPGATRNVMRQLFVRRWIVRVGPEVYAITSSGLAKKLPTARTYVLAPTPTPKEKEKMAAMAKPAPKLVAVPPSRASSPDVLKGVSFPNVASAEGMFIRCVMDIGLVRASEILSNVHQELDRG